MGLIGGRGELLPVMYFCELFFTKGWLYFVHNFKWIELMVLLNWYMYENMEVILH